MSNSLEIILAVVTALVTVLWYLLREAHQDIRTLREKVAGLEPEARALSIQIGQLKSK